MDNGPLAGPLKYCWLNGKDKPMWVFDGEEWTQDDGNEHATPKTEKSSRPRYEEFSPELQVIEIVPVVPRHSNVPPLPLP